ncbi:DEAD-domain-containing protein [Annulohypoxylon maeteangense]|uniref:DEAD-domain-containing protein n=1 Tax=Annulohypoxylon maeteangense TaxID=1927788 RepID=UPI002007715E|nr:DEAD-domain-containing protein [Annulohypoxylon maeteangense]KAI0889527.1 DEAD-domain-containing protein [Annulohypoxylon maeteangense]
MADGGMLLNFDIGGDAPPKRQVKFTGGRWRDRVHAQRSARKNGEGHPTSANFTPLSNDRRHTHHEYDHDERPAKRQRTFGDSNGRTAHSGNDTFNTGPRQTNAPGGVTSRLFTSNPTPRTVFEDVVEETEPAKPSNAPLSDEAENFRALGLSPRIAQHLSSKLEMKAPTSIQKNTIPLLIKDDSDAFLQAETGSGKTLAYLLPIVQRIIALSQNEDGSNTGTRIHRDSGLFALILAPTRELCKQIATVLEKVLNSTPWIVSTTVIGGESKKSEKARLRKGVNILIATPGRLADHLDNTKVLDVGTVRWLVLDEGDRLMEMGFEEELKSIVGKIRQEKLKETNKEGVTLSALPQRRVTVLCSATMKMNVQKLGEISLQDAIHITASKSESENDVVINAKDAGFSAPSQLKQSYIVVPAKLRLVTLIALLKSAFARKGSVMKAIIFISCADSVDFHFDLLRSTSSQSSLSNDTSPTKDTVADAAYITSPANPDITLLKLHGSLQQPVRTSTLAAFHASKNPSVLITTDIASRGLDVPAVDLVIEYDPAFSIDDHVHRIGRTARAGRPGKAALFLQPGCEEGYIELLKSATPLTPQSYDSTLQKGFVTPITLPKSDKGSEAQTLVSERQTPNSRAEALQLHIEQRLLASDKEGTEGGKGGDAKKLLDKARQAFRSHIRAYATHVRDERGFFDITQLHLGHAAKSFGLREAPGGIGGGPSRRTYKPGQQKGGNSGSGQNKSRGDEDNDGENAVDEDAARRMRMKMKQVMSAAGEFNIG